MKNYSTLVQLLFCCSMFLHLKGMNNDIKNDIIIEFDKNAINRRIICNKQASKACIIEYFNKQHELREGYYFNNPTKLYLYDVNNRKCNCQNGIANHLPLIAKFIDTEDPTLVLYDLEYDQLKTHNLGEFETKSIDYTINEHETISQAVSVHAMSENGTKAISLTVNNNNKTSQKILIIDKENNIKHILEGICFQQYDSSISHNGSYLLISSLKATQLWDIAQEKPKLLHTLNIPCEFSINSTKNEFFAYSANDIYVVSNHELDNKKFDNNKTCYVITYSENYYIAAHYSSELTKLALYQRSNSKKVKDLVTIHQDDCLYNYNITIAEDTKKIVIYPTGKTSCSKKIFIRDL